MILFQTTLFESAYKMTISGFIQHNITDPENFCLQNIKLDINKGLSRAFTQRELELTYFLLNQTDQQENFAVKN